MSKIGTIKFSNDPENTFNTIILDTVYTFKTQRNTLGFWSLGIFDEDGNPLVYSVKIVAGSFLMSQYPHILFDVYVPGDIDPTRSNLNEFEMEIWTK